MRVVIRSVSWVLAVAAVVVVVVAWLRPAEDLDAGDATDVAVGALAAAGYEGEVTERPRPGVHETDDGAVVDAWIVVAEVDVDGTTEEIELRIHESAGRPVFVDDRIGDDDRGRLLDDDEFERLGSYEDDPNDGRWLLANVLGSVDALVIVLGCVALARRTDDLWRTT